MIAQAVDESVKDPGWPKLLALLVGLGLFWVWTQVDRRRRAIKEGKQINPFSPVTPDPPLMAPSEVKATLDPLAKGFEKGFGKWLRKGSRT